MPSLRERVEDIPLLVEHYLNIFNKSFQKDIHGLSDEAVAVFMSYPWPGNVRELRHSIEHAFVLCRGPIICLDHLPGQDILEQGKSRTSSWNRPEYSLQKNPQIPAFQI